jgi:hypothetical protein
MIRFLHPVDLVSGKLVAGNFVAGNLVAGKLVANFAAATVVAASMLLPGSIAISELGLVPAGDGISRPPKDGAPRVVERMPLAKGDRLQVAALSEEDGAAQPKGDAIPVRDCDSDGTIAYWFAHGSEPSCPETETGRADSIEADRAYLVETASPGYTMTRQGPELAIARLNPEFARRLAAAVREARQAGLSSAGIYSAYRPPAFGVGGFSNKFNSLHTYGLAVDMSGIGGPGSGDAKTWHEIAARHGVVCPYGSASRTEWNHCQPTAIKVILAQNPLRETVTAEGPVNLDSMFEAGNALIEASAGEGDETGATGYHLASASTRVALPEGCRKACGAHQAAAPAKVLTAHHRFKMHSSQKAS